MVDKWVRPLLAKKTLAVFLTVPAAIGVLVLVWPIGWIESILRVLSLQKIPLHKLATLLLREEVAV